MGGGARPCPLNPLVGVPITFANSVFPTRRTEAHPFLGGVYEQGRILGIRVSVQLQIPGLRTLRLGNQWKGPALTSPHFFQS